MRGKTMGRGALCRASLICLATLIPTVSQANTTASFQASANIVSGCEVGGTLVAGTVPIGQIGTLNYGVRPTLTTGTVTASMVQNPSLQLVCTPDVALTMTVDGGLHSATTRNLQASQTVTRLAYRLYRDVALATELVINQPVSISFTGGTAITLPIFGRVTLPGNSVADIYTDTVVVTLNW